MRFPLSHGDFPRSWQVHIDARAAFFQLERFRVRIQLRFRDLLPVGVEFSKRSAPEPDINPLARGIVPQVIGVVAVLDGFEELQRRSVEYLYRTVFATGNEQLILVRYVERALWLLQSGDCVRALSGSKIDDFDRVVTERRNKQAFPHNVQRHVVDAPLYIR